jgi:hypothetical protein
LAFERFVRIVENFFALMSTLAAVVKTRVFVCLQAVEDMESMRKIVNWLIFSHLGSSRTTCG